MSQGLKRKHEGLANYLQPLGAPGDVRVVGLQPSLRVPIEELGQLGPVYSLHDDVRRVHHLDHVHHSNNVRVIELLKDVAPFTCFLEHDVPRQRLFQSALAAYGREG